jgi:hypothetical protein
MAHQVAHKISGSTIKPNTVTGKQVKESTLGIVPKAKLATKATTATKASTATTASKATSALTAGNATDLGGKPASDYASAANAFSTGSIALAADNTFHDVFTLGPVTWQAECFAGGPTETLTVQAKATASMVLTVGTDDKGAAGGSSSLTSSDSPALVLTASGGLGIPAVNGVDYIAEATGSGATSYHGTVVADVGVANASECTVDISGSR